MIQKWKIIIDGETVAVLRCSEERAEEVKEMYRVLKAFQNSSISKRKGD